MAFIPPRQMPASSKRMVALLAMVLGAAGLLSPAAAASVQTFSPQGEVAKVRQARASFTESMVRFGDPRLPPPFDVACANTTPVTGSGRWVDDKTWVYDFTRDVPAGVRCEFTLKPGLRSLAGQSVGGSAMFAFSTGGPAIVRAYPQPGEWSTVEEEQVFVFLLNGPATASSIEKNGFCEVSGIGERLALKVVEGPVREAILKAVRLTAQRARVATVQCARPLPNEARVSVVWGAGIATPSGVPNSAERRIEYTVRKPFAASFSCERVNSRADCLPIRPLRVEFSSPVPRRFAERIVLVAPDGARKPKLEQGRGEVDEQLISFGEGTLRKFLYLFRRSKGEVTADPSESGVSAVQFEAPLPENAALRIELPADLRDDAGRALSNAGAFPLETKTAAAPALVKFPAATFGVLELNAEPHLPVTVRQVEGDLRTRAVSLAPGAVRDLRLADDASIIEWLARLKRYDESRLPRSEVESELGITLPAPPPRPAKPARPSQRYGESADRDDDEFEAARHLVQTRSVGLLTRDSAARRLSLPASGAGDPRPFEVIGIPMPQAGFHVVEIESPKLGAALLDREAPVYVRTSVLVTNLGVHFKWGSVNSAVWVTTLDKGQPVANAQVQISDCRAKVVWTGRTGEHGLAQVTKELPRLPWRYCHDGPGGDSGREEGYFVSARITDAAGRADMAFVWSTWNQGIEPWRFHVNTGGHDGGSSGKLLHSVLDRTLLRAGQTVSMKHHARRELMLGLGLLDAGELPTELRIVHDGSGQKFTYPLAWRAGRYAQSSFDIPPDAKLGSYRVLLANPHEAHQTATFRVEEFRLPVFTGRIVAPPGALIQPKELALGLQVNYANGGGAASLPVRVSAQMHDADVAAAIRGERFPGFRFEPPREPRDPNARSPFSEEFVDEDDEGRSIGSPEGGAQLVANKLALTLDKNGAGNVTLDKLPALRRPRQLLVQATYADPNGEIQTLSQTMPVWPSGLVLGVRTDSWVSVKQQVATQVVVLDTAGKPAAKVSVSVRAVAHRTSSVRRRLVGGFYAYDNQNASEDLGTVCSGTSDARGLVLCEVELKTPGEVELIAQAKDGAGHLAQAATTIWVTRQGEVWFGGDNQDRMDVIPEQRFYEPGQTARLQVRSPFRQATALVAIERNGIIDTRLVELRGRDPTIELPVKAEWGPNVYVSVLAVRGRVREVPWYSMFSWGWRSPAEWWRAYRDEGRAYQPPTAMVDLSKPAFKLGIAEIQVGIARHRLKVEVTPDKTTYPIRAVSQVRVKVSLPDGRPAPAGTEVALAAVDEALLELAPNTSWDLLKAMIRQRAHGIETATAQMQIIGKRHYGKKAAPAGGGGGQFPTRELFDTLLLWDPRVLLDARGEALVKVPLNDSLTSFRIAAVADVVQGADAALFGTGQAAIRATQDLQIVSGVPPLVREGDRYRAMFTLRNTTPKAVEATLSAQAGTSALTPQTLRIAANGAAEVHWDVAVPFNVKQLEWTVSAEAAGARDRMKIVQAVREAIPVRVQQATLMQIDRAVAIPVAAPASAVATAQGVLRGGIDVTLRPRLGDGLQGVRDYFQRYPWSCMEQRASVALGLRDSERWRAIASQLPLYLDDDGLANYFPPAQGSRVTGSDTLTAYLMSASHEASRLGHDFSIPEDTRAKMERGLIGFVEGRVKRDFWAPPFLRNGDLEVRKIAAIEALSRSGKVRSRLLDSIQILPNQWPTGAVIDWLMILERVKETPERDKRIAEAEQILRARLNVQGTRLGFS
ncbi:partial Alpha-2-macroglobulin, partial [Burkholderiaceae bacterium]